MVRGWWLLVVLGAGCDRIWGLQRESTFGDAYAGDAIETGPCAFQPFTHTDTGNTNGGAIAAAIAPGEAFAVVIDTGQGVATLVPPLGSPPQIISGGWSPHMWSTVAFAAAGDLYLFDSATNQVFYSQKTSSSVWNDPTARVTPANVRGIGGTFVDPTTSLDRMVTLLSDGSFQEYSLDSTWQPTFPPYGAAELGVTGTLGDPSLTSNGLSLVFPVGGTTGGIYGAARPTVTARFGAAVRISNFLSMTPYASTCEHVYVVDASNGKIVLLSP